MSTPSAPDVRRHIESGDVIRTENLVVRGAATADTVVAPRIVQADGTRPGVKIQVDGVDAEGGARFSTLAFAGGVTASSPSAGTARITLPPRGSAESLATILAESNSAGGRDIDMGGGSLSGFTKLQLAPTRTSVSIGSGASATGNKGVAIGRGSSAPGNKTVAIGTSAVASGGYTVALGAFAEATAADAVALGAFAEASGAESVAVGYNAVASAEGAVSVGYNAAASGLGSVAVGSNTVSSGERSVAVGGGPLTGAVASGDFSIAIGPLASATHEESICIGNGAVSTDANELTLAAGVPNKHFKTKGNVDTTAGEVATYLEVNVGGVDCKIALHDFE